MRFVLLFFVAALECCEALLLARGRAGASTARGRPLRAADDAYDEFDAPSDGGDFNDDVPAVRTPPTDDVDLPSDVADVGGTATESASSLEAKLIALADSCDRGESASPSERLAVEALCRDLEALDGESSLEGEWSLVYSSEPGLYRSSPFFWGFSQLLEGQSSPVKVLDAPTSRLSDNVYAITDALSVFYEIGDARHTHSGSETDYGTLVSEVELSLKIPLPLDLPKPSSVMTTTARTFRTPTGLGISLEKTEVKDSSVSKLPGLGFLADIAFPTEAAFDQLADLLPKLGQNAASVECQIPYVSKKLRVTRTSDGYLFVHSKY